MAEYRGIPVCLLRGSMHLRDLTTTRVGMGHLQLSFIS